MATSILALVLWMFVSIIVATVGGLYMTIILMDKYFRNSFGLTSPIRLARFFLSGALREDILSVAITCGSDAGVIFILNSLQSKNLWSKHTLLDLKYIANNHTNWQVRYAAVAALAKAMGNNERQDLQLIVKREKHSVEMTPARVELLEFVESLSTSQN